ncbi:MAG: hypothetical protein PHV37_04715 [Candidatus Gastranaerophilales bacterium]|nr:hypothetical protein [Candidatus Gastranaerophilales bacterium]
MKRKDWTWLKMTKNAFTIAEIIIALFLLVVVASIFIPLNITNVSQAERVAKWKNTYEETKYSISALKAEEPEVFNELSTLSSSDSAKAFSIIKPFLNVKYDSNSLKDLKKYRYKYLNGTKVKENSHFYVDQFAILKSGVIIGFKLNNNKSFSENSPKAIMLFDVNGIEKPNRIGKDIFGVNIFSDGVEPFGEGRSKSIIKVNCSPVGSGVMCSKYYLIGGNF